MCFWRYGVPCSDEKHDVLYGDRTRCGSGGSNITEVEDNNKECGCQEGSGRVAEARGKD